MATRLSNLVRAVTDQTAIQLDKVGLHFLSRMVPRKSWTKNEINEIRLEVQVEETRGNDIRMMVDLDNTLFIQETNLNKVHVYKLPVKGNFEKAEIKPTLKDGMVTVNIKNFKRNEVQVAFTD